MIENHSFDGHKQRFLLGPYEIDTHKNVVIKDDEPCSVEPRLIRVLVKLVEAEGNIVDRQTLLNELSDQSTASDESLTQAISKIRQLFNDDPKNPQYIKTIPRKGYLLMVAATDKPVITARSKPLQRPKPATAIYMVIIALLLASLAITLWPGEAEFIEKGELEFIEKE